MATIRFYISPTSLPFVGDKYKILPFNILYIYYFIAAYRYFQLSWMLWYFPINTSLSHRLIVSPHKFRLAEPKTIFHLTFTDYERGHPFKLLQYCGLVLPFFFNLVFTKYVYVPLYVGNMRRMENPFYTPPGDEGLWYKYLMQPNWYSWMRVGIHVGLVITATLIWTPVHVILTRLAVQPVHGPPNTEPTEERDIDKFVDMGIIAAPSYLQYGLTTTDFLCICWSIALNSLTTEQHPYLGFRDCFKRIVKEEGWGVLYRCWWLTMFGFWVPVLGWSWWSWFKLESHRSKVMHVKYVNIGERRRLLLLFRE